MAAVTDDWSTNSNDAVHISLVTPAAGGAKPIATFHPKFTYPIFGDEESIFGYQQLKILLKFHACDMRPNIQITYNKKFKSVGDVNPTDVKTILEEFLPATAFDKTADFEANINSNTYKEWKPPGELLKTIATEGATYEIWKSSLKDKAVQQFIKRIQILVPFFIEGGTFINLDEPEWSLDRWTVFLLFKKSTIDEALGHSPYIFMGYCTVYKYYLIRLPSPPMQPVSVKQPTTRAATLDFKFPLSEAEIFDLPCRSRISQFVILPPFQGSGSGGRLYETIFDFYLAAPQTIEITVEDPNEQFDDLRDLNDLARLRTLPDFTNLRINTDATVRPKGRVPTGQIVDVGALDSLRRKIKIAPRQFSRLVEMQLLSLIPAGVRQSLVLEQTKGPIEEQKLREREYDLWKLLVKQRLYRHNKDSLTQLSRAEKIDKLEDALGSVEADYARLLRKLLERAETKTPANGTGSGEGPAKRSLSDDDETHEPINKKAKLAKV